VVHVYLSPSSAPPNQVHRRRDGRAIDVGGRGTADSVVGFQRAPEPDPDLLHQFVPLLGSDAIAPSDRLDMTGEPLQRSSEGRGESIAGFRHARPI
jgi:hypothetical protein